MALPNRKDVASELTWDLTPLYPNDKAWAKRSNSFKTTRKRSLRLILMVT